MGPNVVVEYVDPITGLQIRAIGVASRGSKKGGKPDFVTFYKAGCGYSYKIAEGVDWQSGPGR
jgi:hypothetical protein